MKIEVQAKQNAKDILLQYGIAEPTLENVIYIIEEHGYELLEYSRYDTDSAIYQVIERLNLMPYALSGKAFAYRHNETKVVFVCEEMSASEKLYALAHELGHIVKHIGADKKRDYIDIIKRDIEDTPEVEANMFAEKALMADAPLENLFEQLKRSPFTAKGPILIAAQAYKINPGIITGQFQHYCGTYSACRDLLTNIN